MVKIAWKQKEIIEFSDADKARMQEEMKHKSITEEHAIKKEIEKRIKHDIEVLSNSLKLKLEKESGEYYLDIYSVKFYYPGPDEKLSGSADATGVGLETLKKLLKKLSNHVLLKVVEGGKKLEYYKGQEEIDPDLFDPEKIED